MPLHVFVPVRAENVPEQAMMPAADAFRKPANHGGCDGLVRPTG
jgi:hypothetical protein